MSVWALSYRAFKPEEEKLREALCTLGNGYCASRGASPEAAADDVHYPGTYVGGCFNRLSTTIAGRTLENEDMVNLPNWLCLTFRIGDGPWFDLSGVEILAYRQDLDLRRGVLTRRVRFRDGERRTTKLTQRRFVHMGEKHLAALQTTLVAEDWSGRIEVLAALDGEVRNTGVVRYRELSNDHLVAVDGGVSDAGTMWLVVETSQSHIRVAEAARTRLLTSAGEIDCEREVVARPRYVAQLLRTELRERQPLTVEKVVALYTSRDRAISEPGLAARAAVDRAGSFAELLESHARAWQRLWDRGAVSVGGNERVARVLNLHTFHVLQSVSPNTVDEDVAIPARGLSGEGYRGHVFWDELYIFPLLTLAQPEVVRSLLLYRYRRLPEARAAAREAGYRGAMFPWQSGSDGREETQVLHLNPRSGRWLPDESQRQRHVSAAIAYNVWRYYEWTRDHDFLSSYGAEVIIEIARFWASLTTYDPGVDRYEILGVMGPDEYHDGYPGEEPQGLANNAYTNVMVAWLLARALESLDLLPELRRRELLEQLDVQPQERALWDSISRRLRIVFHEDGVISQFEGYERLEEFAWARYRRRYGDIARLDRILEAEGDTPNRYKLSKQADVLMLPYLFSSEELVAVFARLGYPLEQGTLQRTVDFYRRRTSHGSTLSRVVHSWVLARSDPALSWRLFMEALLSDVNDIQGGTTPEGVHMGVMAGTLDLVKRCFTGLGLRGDTLSLDPCLPRALGEVRYSILFRGQWVDVECTHELLRASTRRSGSASVTVDLRGRVTTLSPGQTAELPLRS